MAFPIFDQVKIILFDHPETKGRLMPFTLTRSVGEIRLGIGTIQEKWEWISGTKVYIKNSPLPEEDFCFVDSSLIPDENFFSLIQNLQRGQALTSGGRMLAAYTTESDQSTWSRLKANEVSMPEALDRLWKIFQLAGREIGRDFTRITKGRTSAGTDDPFTKIYNPSGVFVESGAVVKAAIINAEAGPVYLGKNSQVLEGSVIQGPFALGEGSVISMSSVIRGETSIGPQCRAGGEIKNSVFFSHTNKAHHGFLGNAVLGSWCNLGAGSTASNLKNNFKTIRLWDEWSQQYEETGLQFCGLFMGDYATSAVNTSFNTATWVGAGARVLGAEFPPVRIKPFVQGGSAGFKNLPIQEVTESARRFFALKKMEFTESEKNLIEQAFALAAELGNSGSSKQQK